MSRVSNSIFLLIAFGLGAFVAQQWNTSNSKATEEASVLLERIEAVAKLVTVEGHFSEIYDYNDYKGAFPLFWDKKALIRVQAKVLAGYDLESLEVRADEASRTIFIKNIPKVELLSIDHRLDFYNIQEGLFSNFSQSDHNKIQAQAKQFIAQKARESTLLESAEQEGQNSIEVIRFMVQGMGWTLVVAPVDTFGE